MSSHHDEFSGFSLAAGKIMEESIMVDILLRLPVKSLSRFKCVCKSWRSLIAGPQFARAHLNRSMLVNPNSSQRLLCVLNEGHKYMLKSLDYERSNFESCGNDFVDCPVRFELPEPTTVYNIVRSCDGLVCLDVNIAHSPGRTIVVWNPTTGKFKQITPPTTPRFGFVILGFGYDPASDDYKIVAFVYGEEEEVSIFALKEKSWRSLRSTPPWHVPGGGRGIYLNGCFHWFRKDWNMELGGITHSIFSFDLSVEKFQAVIPLPNNTGDMLYYDLAVLGGRLFLYKRRTCDGGSAKCWIMNEHGSKSSWVEFGDLTCYEGRDREGEALCLRTDGKVLVLVDDREDFTPARCFRFLHLLCLHSPDDNSFKLVNLGVDLRRAEMYVESLVSP